MYDLNSNILEKTGVTVEQLSDAINSIRPDNRLVEAVPAMVAMEKKYTISALFIAAHAALESGWGLSMFAQTRNNLFGFNAVDSAPGKASRYPSKSASVEFYAQFLNEHYLHEGGQYYNGATPHGIMVRYASAGDRAANTIAEIMNMLANKIGLVGKPLPDGFPSKPQKTVDAVPDDGKYTVVKGDNMSVIAERHGISLKELKRLNPDAGHPKGNFDIIWPGDVLMLKDVEQDSEDASDTNAPADSGDKKKPTESDIANC